MKGHNLSSSVSGFLRLFCTLSLTDILLRNVAIHSVFRYRDIGDETSRDNLRQVQAGFVDSSGATDSYGFRGRGYF